MSEQPSAPVVTVPPSICWAGPGAAPHGAAPCPNCGSLAPKPLRLSVAFTPLNWVEHVLEVVDCSDCTCCFYPSPMATDYGADEMLTRGRAALYLQQGAGLAQLFRPIARIAAPPGSRVLDVGCGFGFGLDFALQPPARGGKGWVGGGIDPAQLAGLGRDLLGLPIEQRLLQADEPALAGACDVVITAETLEHVPDPADFLRILRSVLTPGGVLALTTPAAEAITPAAPLGQVGGLLSPSLHIVIQSEASLRLLLARAGFSHVQVERDGGALVAYASTAPLALDTGDFTPAYLRYLQARAAAFSHDDDLFWGFAGRGFLEAVNAGDGALAVDLRARLVPACLQRFGIDLAEPHLPPETATCTLERMAALMPLNLSSLLYADAMLALAGEAPRPSQTVRLRAAADAAHRLRRAVADLGMEDPWSEELGWVCQAEAALCAEDPAEFLALADAPGDSAGSRRTAILARGFVSLVNAGRTAEARQILQASPFLAAPPPGPGRDAVFCRAILGVQPQGDPAAARADFAWVRESFAAGPPCDLFWAALRGEALAHEILGHDDLAHRLRRDILTQATQNGWPVPADLASPPTPKPQG